MVSSTVNVVRYTALFSGVLFGWYHQRTLQSAHNQHKLEHAVHDRQRLVAEAKEAWKRKLSSANDPTVVSDPEDPRFDLEKLLAKWENAS